MRLSRRHRPHGVSMDMTPMIDVVFQLIIFFMTVNQLSRVENAPVELPHLKGAQDQANTTLTINLTRDNQIVVAQVPLSLAQLEARVRDDLARTRGHPELLTIVLRVDRRIPSELANKVLEMLKRAGIARSRIAVEVAS